MRDYVTRAAHTLGDGTVIPAGTPCRVQRSPDGSVLALSFKDGNLLLLDGTCWYLEGLEPRGVGAFQVALDLQAQEDKIFVEGIEQALTAIPTKAEE
mgnify:CR=1 FL=1